MKPRSDNLFHFTKNISALKGILKNGFYPRYCLEDIRYLDEESGHIAYPMVCFCDIPISRISEHTNFYGEYGIGLTKEWGLRNGLCPVIYTPISGRIPSLVKFLLNTELAKVEENETATKELVCQLFSIAPLVKQLTGKMFVSGNFIDKDFYQENEWRYVPDDYEVLLHDEKYEQKKIIENKKHESTALTIDPSDIKYIFIKNDHEIPELVDFISNTFGTYSLNDAKTLYSRIISLETIDLDL